MVEVNEGRSVTVTVEADGAEKVYWILRRGDEKTVVVSNRFSYTVDAGRVTSDAVWSLQFKAVYPDTVKTRDVPIAVKDSIPEPQVVLEAPRAWNGRDPIKVVPRISNRDAMKAAGVGELRYRWVVSGGAVAESIATSPPTTGLPVSGFA